MHKTVIAAVGGDARQKIVLDSLQKSYELRIFGMGSDLDTVSRGQESFPKELLEGADVLLLPMPASTDGVRVYSPLASSETGLRFSTLLNFFCGRLLLGGRLPEILRAAAEKKGIACIDYLDTEVFQLKNAMPTAEGAIFLAMQALPVTLDGSEVAVIGYGRIGELLAQRLAALGARVSVLARRRETLTRAELQHYRTILLFPQDPKSSFSALGRNCRVIFNTVPARLLTKEILLLLPQDCLLIDLASSPGGVDLESARALGFEAIWGTALPGKYAPQTAGRLLASSVEAILQEALPLQDFDD